MSPALFFTLFVFVVLPLISMLIHEVRSRRERYEPPGELIDVGGYRLHLLRMGDVADTPTVILEAGGGGFSLEWEMVQRRVAEFACVCSYDRAGYGWSDDSPYARTPEQIVEELYTLLQQAQITAPYILVGHSIGGDYMRRFALRYPERVKGLVLVDAVHPQQWFEPMISQHSQVRQQQVLSVMARLGLLRMAAESKFRKLQMPPEIKAAHAAKVSRGAYRTVTQEVAAIHPTREDIEGTLGNLPLIVLTQTPKNHRLSRVVQRFQADLPRLSSNNQHWIAANSTHYIHLDEPELVVKAVRELWEKAKT